MIRVTREAKDDKSDERSEELMRRMIRNIEEIVMQTTGDTSV